MHLFLDSPVFLTALGLPSESRPACARLLDRAGEGELSLHNGAECIQEIVFHRLRLQGVDLAVAQTQAVRALCVVHPMDDEVLETGLGLIRDYGARGRDAFIAATALIAGFDTLLTTDRRFVDIPGLRRMDPADVSA